MLGVAEAVVMNFNGEQASLRRKADTNSAFKTIKCNEAELERKNSEISTLKADVSNLKNLGMGEWEGAVTLEVEVTVVDLSREGAKVGDSPGRSGRPMLTRNLSRTGCQ